MASLSRPKGLAKQGRNFSLAEFSTTTPSAGLRPFPTSMKIQKIKFSRAYFDPDMINTYYIIPIGSMELCPFILHNYF